MSEWIKFIGACVAGYLISYGLDQDMLHTLAFVLGLVILTRIWRMHP